MKKIFISIMAAAAILSGCNNVLIEDAGYGQFSFDLSASDEYVSITKASENEDVNEFKINIVRPADGFTKNFDRFGDMPQMLTLPAGSYKLTATSPATLPAAFDQPIYGVEHDFVVKVGETASEKLVCTLRNMKVTFELSDAFKTELSSYTITVSNGETAAHKLYWTNAETEAADQYTTTDMTAAGYFEVAPLTIRVDAKRALDGSDAYHEIKITDGKAKDHFIVKLDAKVTGQASFEISIDPGVNVRDDEEVYVPGFDEDAVEDEWDTPVEGEDDNTGSGDDNTGSGDDNTGSGDDNTGSGDDNTGTETPANDMTMTWEGHESVNNVYPTATINDNLGSVALTINVPGKIKGFEVLIESEDEAFEGAICEMSSEDANPRNKLDLINDQTAIEALTQLGFDLNLAGQTEVLFDITSFMPMIKVVASPGTTHTFTLTVTDESGYSESWELSFLVPAA